MINYKIIEKEKSGTHSNYRVYYIYRDFLGLKIWVKSSDNFFPILLAFGLALPSLLLSCGCSEYQNNSFPLVYGAMLLTYFIIYKLCIKKSFTSYNQAEQYIKDLIRKKQTKYKKEVAEFSFDKNGENVSKTINFKKSDD